MTDVKVFRPGPPPLEESDVVPGTLVMSCSIFAQWLGGDTRVYRVGFVVSGPLYPPHRPGYASWWVFWNDRGMDLSRLRSNNEYDFYLLARGTQL